VILNRAAASQLWPDADPLGKRLRLSGNDEPWREVVGVVGDERDDGMDKKAPAAAYWPILMDHFEGEEIQVRRTLSYMVRSPRAGSDGFVNEVSRAVWSVNPNLPLAGVRTLAEVVSASMARTSFTLVMLAIAGGMALALGLLGIYGVLAYIVSQRSREIGIRLALGAQPHEVRKMFLRHGLMLTGIGLAIGLIAALGVTRLMSSLLFGVAPTDPTAYAAALAVILAAAALASYLPARRAAAIDPVETLKAE
jgi:predicted lysophospholipase L1 biosynthesis ABC-type transport system permease subunit